MNLDTKQELSVNLNNIKKFVISICITISAFFLFSIASSCKRLSPASPVLGPILTPLVKKESRLEVACEWMSGNESKEVFGHDFPDRKIYPLKISIQNNTARDYSLSASSIDLPAMDPSAVAMSITKSTIPRSIAYKVASLFFWPLMIPSTIDGIKILSHHNSLKKDIRAKSLKYEEGETVAPYSTFHRVLFVDSKNKKDDFKVTIIDVDNADQNTFDIKLNK